MLKRLMNEIQFDLSIETKSPFLIRESRYEKGNYQNNRQLPNNLFICNNTKKEIDDAVRQENFSNLRYYIPGTSLRGWIRSHAEKIVRTLSNEDAPYCCDPFEDQDEINISCSKRLDGISNKKNSGFVPYANVCVICKLFGCTGTASRITIGDSGIVQGSNKLKSRDGIGIDRFTGGNSSSALFKNQILEKECFTSKITIKNFEIWQLGLLAYVFRDMEREQVPLGFGKSKGFGKVKASIENIQISYYGSEQKKLKGIGEISSNRELKLYGFVKSNIDIDLVELGNQSSDFDYRYSYRIKDENATIAKSNFWKSCAGAWNTALNAKDEKGTKFFKTIRELKEITDSLK